MKPWKIVKLAKRSQKWLAWREAGVGVSEAGYLIDCIYHELSPRKKFRTCQEADDFGSV
jgi:hypothetical protein